jgi:D-3-phosphoglycerate dehydrogenase|tara:strand:+ start:7723 stop:8700 length:978 start_codon:yes stop_codon:yes gene_type:complete
MARIAVTDGMDKNAVNILEKNGHKVVIKHYSKEELLEGALSDFDAVVIRSATKLTKAVLHASVKEGGGISFIGRAGVGVDNIDISVATENSMIVCNTPRSSTHSVVELTIGHLLTSCRHIATADRLLREGIWAKKQLKGTELSGKRLGLIGYGRIAQGVGNVAQSLGMEIHAYDPYLPPEIARKNNVTLHNDVNSVFSMCTHISVHCNLTDETHHLVNEDRLNLMPQIGVDGTNCGNHIVNCARGGIVDEKATLSALESGKLTSAALDVFEKEPAIGNQLLTHQNFHGTPHIGAATMEAQSRIGLEMATQLIDHFNGQRPHSALN